MRQWDEYVRLTAQMFALARKGEMPAALALFNGDMRTALTRYRETQQADLNLNTTEGTRAADRGADAYAAASWVIEVALALAALACFALGWLIVANVSAPVRRMTATMRQLAAHDLTAEVDGGDRKDELGAMAAAVQVFKDNMIEADRLAAEQAAEQARKAE